MHKVLKKLEKKYWDKDPNIHQEITIQNGKSYCKRFLKAFEQYQELELLKEAGYLKTTSFIRIPEKNTNFNSTNLLSNIVKTNDNDVINGFIELLQELYKINQKAAMILYLLYVKNQTHQDICKSINISTRTYYRQVSIGYLYAAQWINQIATND